MTEPNTQEAFEQGQDKLRGVFNQAERKIRQGQERVNQWAYAMDQQTKENPWPLIGGVSLFAFLVGVIIGKSRT